MFQWNGERYGNHSLLDPSGIGEGMEALFCLTPRLDCCKRGGNNGDWFDSEGQDVPIGTELGEDSGFYNNRGVSAVRLNRRGSLSSDFTSGIFLCEIPDVDDIPQYLYIGLYLPNTGMKIFVGGIIFAKFSCKKLMIASIPKVLLQFPR